MKEDQSLCIRDQKNHMKTKSAIFLCALLTALCHCSNRSPEGVNPDSQLHHGYVLQEYNENILKAKKSKNSPTGKKNSPNGSPSLSVPGRQGSGRLKNYPVQNTAVFEKDINHAIREIDKDVVVYPRDSKSYYNRGCLYQNKGNIDRAIDDYDTAIEINPRLTPSYYNRGLAYFDKGEYWRAIRDYDMAIKLDPTFTQAYNNRGIAHNIRGEYDYALKNFNKAIRLDPEHTPAYFNRGLAYTKQGNFEVVDNTRNKALYAMDSTVFNTGDTDITGKDLNAASGWGVFFTGWTVFRFFCLEDVFIIFLEHISMMKLAIRIDAFRRPVAAMAQCRQQCTKEYGGFCFHMIFLIPNA